MSHCKKKRLREQVFAEAVGSTALADVTRQLAKTELTEKTVSAVMNYKVCELGIAV
jgi:hypothetical protein